MKPEITRGSLAQRVRERERERDARRQQAFNQSTEIAIVKRSISMCLRCSRAPPTAATDARANDCRRVSDARETQDISGRERGRGRGRREHAPLLVPLLPRDTCSREREGERQQHESSDMTYALPSPSAPSSLSLSLFLSQKIIDRRSCHNVCSFPSKQRLSFSRGAESHPHSLATEAGAGIHRERRRTHAGCTRVAGRGKRISAESLCRRHADPSSGSRVQQRNTRSTQQHDEGEADGED